MATQNQTDGRPQPVAIGIDLGSSKCCVAAVRDGRAHVLENEFGQRTTPSWVAFNSQQRLVGGAALDQAVVNCANTVSAVKRTLGRTYDDVKHLSSPCKVIRNYDSFQYCVSYKKYNKCLGPEQITAMMLTKMKDIAETSLGCAVNRAVISVPASYGNAQRVALKTAAEVAGLEVLQLINETTAAGIAFADNRTATTPVTIAVVDFGAGKLDVSVMEVKEKSVKVIAAAGNPNLGGCNIDRVLSDHCAALIREDCKITLTAIDKAMLRLRLACEKVKKTLSLLPQARLVVDSLMNDTNVDIPVNRKDLNVLIESEIHKEIVEICNRILQENNIEKDTIDKVVLVGGSTRIPAVRSILEEYFGSHKLDQTVNQDEAVAQGAALRAAALSGAAAGIEVADVSSFDIFFRSHDSQIKTIFWRNSRIPVSMDLPFSTWGNCWVECYEKSNSKERKKDALIGSVKFWGFNEIIIHVELNTDGICKLSVPHYYTVSVQRRMYPFYPAHVLSNWTRDENQFRRDIENEMKRVEAEVHLESLIFEVQSAIQDPEIVKYSHSNLKFLESKCSTAQSCVDDISSVPEYKIKAQIKTMSEAKTEVERMKVTAHKKAAEEKATKERAELEQAVTQKNSELRSLHHELLKSLKQPELVQYSPPEEIKKCEEVLARIDTSQKFVSLKEVSEKIVLLNDVKSRIVKLEESSRRKALKEKEEAKEKNQHLKEEITSGLSMVKSLRGKLLSSEQKEAGNSQLTDNFQQKIKELEESLHGVHGWVSDTDTSSLSEILKKIEEVNEIIADVVELEDTLRLAQIKKTGLSESSTEKSNNVFEMPFSENDGQIDQINNSDERLLHSQSGDMRAQSTNSSAGHTSRSREKLRRKSPSRSRSTERKENVDGDRSRSPLPKGIETGRNTPPFGSLRDTERNKVSTVLSPGTKVESNYADGGYRPSRETSTDASKFIPSCRREKEHHPPVSLATTRVVLNHADGGCRPSQETRTDASKLDSSCVKEKEHHQPASLVTTRVVLDHTDEGCRPSEETPADTSKLHSFSGKEKEHHQPASLVTSRAVLDHADGECRTSEETTADASKLYSSCGKEKEHQPASLVNTKMELDKADIGCRPSEEIPADTSKLDSSCGKEKEHHPPATRVSSNAKDKNSAAVRSSSASASVPNGADHCSETTSVPVSGQSSMVSIPGMENCVDSNSNNATDSNTVVGSQRSSPEEVSSVRNDVVKNSTPAVVRSPSGAGERESETAPAQLEREPSKSSNGPNDLQENVAKTSNLFYQHPDVQSRIKREIDTCNSCRISRRACYKTRTWLLMLLNEMIDDTATQIFESAASGCNGEAPQQVTPKAQASVPEVLEQVKKLSNRDIQRR